MSMKSIVSQFGIIQAFLVGLGLVVLGLVSLNHILNSFWPIDVARLDLVRAAARGQAGSTILMEAANPVVILVFLAAVLIIVIGFFLPIAYFFNRRFGQGTSSVFVTALRQATWVGCWFAFCTWLQMHRTLGLGVAVLVAVVLVVIELLLQLKSRTASIAG